MTPMIALLPWGDFIEDFLDGIGVSLEEFCSKMTGGWLFGYVEALRRQGIRCSIFCFSERVESTVHKFHEASGANIIVMRGPRSYRGLRRHIKDPYGASVETMFGPSRGISRQYRRFFRQVTPYLATPIRLLAREIRRAGCNAILCQEYESPRFDTSVAVGNLLRIPVFATFQGGIWHRSRIEDFVRPITLRRCAGLIIGSSIEETRVREGYGLPAEKIQRIFNPLDIAEWQASSRMDARIKLGIGESTRVAVWHGRIDIRRKGLDILLGAWKNVCMQRQDRDILLMLIGSGPDVELLDKEIREMALSRIRWIRSYVLDRPMMRQYLSAADVYVFPSRHEGFPVAPLEAMACGLPIVAAAAPGICDILNDGEESGGIVVPIGDAPALGGAVGRMLDSVSEGRVLGARARLRVERGFSLQTVGVQLHEFLRKGGGLRVWPD